MKKESIKKQRQLRRDSPLVSVIMGSSSDYQVMEGAISLLKDFEIPFEVQVVSAHRTPQKMQTYALKAEKRGIRVIIAGAGGSAHLPGMVAALTNLPVIGVPVEVGKLKGLDALLSIAQMPKGVPVATVAIDHSFNAALLAAKILALFKKEIRDKLEDFSERQKIKVKEMNQKLKESKFLL